MAQDPRLERLMQALSEIVGTPIENETTTIGDLGIDSKYLVDMMLVCEEVYGRFIEFDQLEIGYETSLLNIHQQLVDREAVQG